MFAAMQQQATKCAQLRVELGHARMWSSEAKLRKSLMQGAACMVECLQLASRAHGTLQHWAQSVNARAFATSAPFRQETEQMAGQRA